MSKIFRICILGGTGFVGRHLSNRLAKEGHQLKILTRHREKRRDLLVLPTIQLVQSNVHDQESLIQQFRNIDIVINLIGILNEKNDISEKFNTVHVALSRNILDCCRRNGIRRYLHVGALNAEIGKSNYLKTKAKGLNLVQQTNDINITSFCPSVIFGPDDDFFNRFAQLLKLLPLFFPLACPNSKFAPIFVDDVVEVMALSLYNKATFNQSYNLCGPQAYTLKELVQYTAQLIGLKRSIIGLTLGLSSLQARLIDLAPHFVFQNKPFSRDNFLSLQTDSICSDTFPSVFGIKPKALETVVPLYLAQHQQRNQFFKYRKLARRDGSN